MKMAMTRAWAGLLGLLFLTASCATTAQVREIVESSNQALQDRAELRALMRGSDGPPLAVAADPAAPEDTSYKERQTKVEQRRADSLARIDAFLVEHPDKPNINNALYIRKAFLHLAGGERNMARAAFAQFRPDLPGSERDHGLYLANEPLAWWTEQAAMRVGPNGKDKFQADAARHAAALGETMTKLSEGGAIRLYLATVRAHIMLRSANLDTDKTIKLEQGLKEYSQQFDSALQRQVIHFVKGTDADLKQVPLDRIRWISQFVVTYRAYARLHAENVAKLVEASKDPARPQLTKDCAWVAEIPLQDAVTP